MSTGEPPKTAGIAAPEPLLLGGKVKQHRCHARLADVVHTIMTLSPTLTPTRVSLLMRCYASDVGSEPTEPHLVDPAVHALKLRSFKTKTT